MNFVSARTATMQRHIDEDVLEAYALGKLKDDGLTQVEEHLLLCVPCQDQLRKVETFIKALRGVAADLFDSYDFVHDTEAGPVHLTLIKAEGRWVARFWGENLEGMLVFGDARDASRYLGDCFSEMFPAHQCTPRCGPRDKVSARPEDRQSTG